MSQRIGGKKRSQADLRNKMAKVANSGDADKMVKEYATMIRSQAQLNSIIEQMRPEARKPAFDHLCTHISAFTPELPPCLVQPGQNEAATA